jgi:hypothetical protein
MTGLGRTKGEEISVKWRVFGCFWRVFGEGLGVVCQVEWGRVSLLIVYILNVNRKRDGVRGGGMGWVRRRAWAVW